ncbi:hypothetical protein CICLE_v10005057mg [Citrus x clementina]|uniref:SAGA-associated factor 11 n=1 Tax=Citrus clementina TaxID=85681 RepID=V4S2F4_CITCL|nr:hypothetical protein CICLE_v10005057mg [Citrus x clementina]ESR32919.1 hypothetical protein CICLE_v10005057mg [Citrus x clementina]
MVCSSGSRRLAVMARLLDAGSFVSQIGADEVSYHKLAAQNIYRELSEADEANLLDEEDMHIFGSKPMADPLHLVSCNACKKPIKASQYAAHAELCRSLNATGEYILDVHGGTGHRKPPRKERKKLLTAYINQATPVTDQERSESLDVDDNSSVSVDVKRNSACVNIASAMDGSGVSSENTDHSACVMPPPTKRSKLIAGEHLPLPGDQPMASGVTKTLSSQDAHNCKARYDSLSFCFLFFSKVFSTNAPEKWSFLCSILVNNLSITQVMCWLMPLYEGYSLKIIAVTLWLSA